MPHLILDKADLSASPVVRTADAAGTDWQSAVFRKIGEEVKAERGLTVERLVKLAGVSRASYYRFDDNAEAGTDRTWTCAMRSSASDWTGPCTDADG
jgi:hypothetical protein